MALLLLLLELLKLLLLALSACLQERVLLVEESILLLQHGLGVLLLRHLRVAAIGLLLLLRAANRCGPVGRRCWGGSGAAGRRGPCRLLARGEVLVRRRGQELEVLLQLPIGPGVVG